MSRDTEPDNTQTKATAMVDPAVTVGGDTADSPAALNHASPMSRYRWVICALLLFATTINYLDRQVLGLLKPSLMEEFAWTETQYGRIVFSFSLAYMIGLLVVGRILDAVGTRLGFGVAALLWSLASMAHAFAGSWQTFSVARFALGVTEAANFPAAVKATAEWFPKKERALATGIFNSGSNIGIIVAAVTVPFIAASTFGWRAAFVVTGLPGVIFVVLWLTMYRKPREHPRVSPSELAYIESDPPDPPGKVRWLALLPHRQTWAFAAGKFLTDPVWWFFLFWGPSYFASTYGVSLVGLALPMVIIYVAADVGSIGGGWLSSAMLKRGFTVNAARKTAMLVCALCAAPMAFAAFIDNMWVSVALISLAAAAHQGWSANLYTLVSDTFPRRAVGSVVGFGGMFGMISSMTAALGIGILLDALNKNYVPLLTIAGFMYVIALLVIHLLAPRLDPADLADPATAAFEPIPPSSDRGQS